MGNKTPLLLLLCSLFIGCALGFLGRTWQEARTLDQMLADHRTPNALISGMATALEKSTTALARTTAERDRLLEHLADVESGAGTACTPLMVWVCSTKGGE